MNSPFTQYWVVALLISASPAFALDQIVRPYQSVRSFGMGGTKITTGLYDDNFFGNPARVTANPVSKFTFFEFAPLDINSRALSTLSPIMAGKDPLTTIADSAGNNLHERFQLVLPAYYRAATEDRKFSLALGFLVSVQTDIDLRQSYRLNLGAIADLGPALTVGYKFLPDDVLSIGLTTHLSYRISTDPNYSLVDYISGSGPSFSNLAGDGSMVDFDLGTTYRVAEAGNFELTVAAAIQNILGGTYSNLSFRPLGFANRPMNQPRSYGIGLAASRASWGNFSSTSFALEATDVLNNRDGSLFRLIHIGAETHWRSIIVRLGLNQGYWTAGLGLDLRFFTLNLASYGEEMSLDVGEYEDRRYAANIGFHF
jgi:hypothetical protein